MPPFFGRLCRIGDLVAESILVGFLGGRNCVGSENEFGSSVSLSPICSFGGGGGGGGVVAAAATA